jgi:hypothetical protein
MTATPQLPDMTPTPDIEIFDGAFRFELEDARRLLANVPAAVDALERGCRDSDDLGMIFVTGLSRSLSSSSLRRSTPEVTFVLWRRLGR